MRHHMFSVEAVVSAPRCVCVLQCTHPCWRPVPRCSQHHPLLDEQVFETLYGKKAAALYTQAGDYQKTARFYYKKAEDTYYQVPRSFRSSRSNKIFSVFSAILSTIASSVGISPFYCSALVAPACRKETDARKR